MKSFFVAAALFGLITQAQAEQCDNPQSQTEMNTCAQYGFDKADAELNDAYRDLVAVYKTYDFELRKGNPQAVLAVPTLLASQRAWILQRDAECKLDGIAVQFGSAHTMVVLSCQERLTSERITWLRKRLSCEEGDMTCIPSL